MDTAPTPAPTPEEITLRTAVIATALSTAAGFAVRLAGIFRRVPWQDEVDFWIGALSSQRSPQAAPLPAALYGAVAGLFHSKDPMLLRWVSVVLGTVAVPAAYLLGRALVNRRVGALTALIVALSPASWYWAQELRPYALYQLLTTLTLLAFVRGYVQDGPWARHGFFVGILLCYTTHLVTVPFAAGLAAYAALSLWTLHDRNSLRRFLSLLVSIITSGLMGLLWIRNRWNPVSGVMEGGYRLGFFHFVRTVLWSLGPSAAMVPPSLAVFDGLALALVAVATIGFLELRRAQIRPRAWLIPIVIGVMAGALYLQLGVKSTYNWNRYLVLLVPFYAVLVASGVAFASAGRPAYFRRMAIAILISLYLPDLVRFSIQGQTSPGVDNPVSGPVIAREQGRLRGVLLTGTDVTVSSDRVLNAYAMYRSDRLPAYLVMDGRVLFFDDSVMSRAPVALETGRRPDTPIIGGEYAVVSWDGEGDDNPCAGLKDLVEPGACRAVTLGSESRGLRFVSIGKGGL